MLGPFAPGAALIAMKAGVPMVPTGIIGTSRILHNGGFLPRVEIHFAPAVPTTSETVGDGKKTMEEVGQAVRIAIENILNGAS